MTWWLWCGCVLLWDWSFVGGPWVLACRADIASSLRLRFAHCIGCRLCMRFMHQVHAMIGAMHMYATTQTNKTNWQNQERKGACNVQTVRICAHRARTSLAASLPYHTTLQQVNTLPNAPKQNLRQERNRTKLQPVATRVELKFY